MIRDIRVNKEKVEQILADTPETRDCDKKLLLEYLRRHHDLDLVLGQEPFNALKDIFTSPDTATPESITRCRRKLQSEGLYVGTKRQEKLEEEEKVRDYFRD